MIKMKSEFRICVSEIRNEIQNNCCFDFRYFINTNVSEQKHNSVVITSLGQIYFLSICSIKYDINLESKNVLIKIGIPYLL